MKHMILSIIILLASACSSLRKENDHINTDQEFLPTIRLFERDFKVEVTVPVKFDKMDEGLAGVCQFYRDGFREVKINKLVWAKLNEEQKEILVYHELVHCELRIDHIPPVQYDNGCPLGVMIPMIFSNHQAVACYKKHRAYYIAQINMHRILR